MVNVFEKIENTVGKSKKKLVNSIFIFSHYVFKKLSSSVIKTCYCI